jgi:hypothetical protein
MGKMFLIAMPAVLLLAPSGAPSAEPSMTEWFRFLATEVRHLRLEILADRIERREARVAGMQREVERLRRAAQLETDAQGGQADELRQLDEQLRDTGLSADQRSAFEELRTSILARPRGPVPDREDTAALATALHTEQERLASLRAIERALNAAATAH